MRILLFLDLILLAVSGLLISNPMPGQAAADSLPILGSEWALDSSFGNGGIARFSVTGHVYNTLIISRSFLLPGGQVLAGLDISWSNGRAGYGESSQFLRFSPAGSLEEGHLGYREKIIALQSGDRFLAMKWGNYPTPPVVWRDLSLPIDVIHSVLLQPDGKLLLAGGEGDDFVLLRLDKLQDATLTFFPFLEQCFSEVLDSPFCEE